METSARIILDSMHPEFDYRVTTFEVTFHRFVLAEMNTHRKFSKNSASSRAIPVKKQIQRVRESPAFPLSWPKEMSGMQGGEEFNADSVETLQLIWKILADKAADIAEFLMAFGLHKSVTNRLLEPFMWHTAIISSTEWDNFWGLRCNPLAQPEIRAVAEMMKKVYTSSVPRNLQYGEWHLPMVTGYDWNDIKAEFGEKSLEVAQKASVARCARVSYLTHDTNKRDLIKDIALADKLAHPESGPMHASPFEHVCTPATGEEMAFGHVRGNFTGWHQLRHKVEDEFSSGT